MCLYPRLIRNKRYQPNKKNGGMIPPVKDTRALHIEIPCENCIECRKKKTREWQVRLQEDIKHNPGAKFITLTFSNEQLKKVHQELMQSDPENWGMTGFELDNKIATFALRRFNERYRKKYKKALRHWLVTELGHNGTENIHLHGIIWPQCTLEEIEQLWQYGWCWKYKLVGETKINYVNAKTVNYIIKYVSKTDQLYPYYKSKILCSPGIGHQYTKTTTARRNQFNHDDTREYYLTTTGHKMALPKYWRNKLYNDDQREYLWMKNLNKEITYICKEKISTKHTHKHLLNARADNRKKNARLGFGSWKKDETLLQWQEQRRAKQFMLRINNVENSAPRGFKQKDLDLY